MFGLTHCVLVGKAEIERERPPNFFPPSILPSPFALLFVFFFSSISQIFLLPSFLPIITKSGPGKRELFPGPDRISTATNSLGLNLFLQHEEFLPQKLGTWRRNAFVSRKSSKNLVRLSLPRCPLSSKQTAPRSTRAHSFCSSPSFAHNGLLETRLFIICNEQYQAWCSMFNHFPLSHPFRERERKFFYLILRPNLTSVRTNSTNSLHPLARNFPLQVPTFANYFFPPKMVQLSV